MWPQLFFLFVDVWFSHQYIGKATICLTYNIFVFVCNICYLFGKNVYLLVPIITDIYTCTSLDVPYIVSSDKLVYLDPREKIWDGQSGRLFMLSEVLYTDNVSPFHGIADFN